MLCEVLCVDLNNSLVLSSNKNQMSNSQSLSMERQGLIAHNSLIYAQMASGGYLLLCLLSTLPMLNFDYLFMAQSSFIMSFCIFSVALQSLSVITCCPLVASKLNHPSRLPGHFRNLSANAGLRAESFRTVLVTSPGVILIISVLFLC